MVDHDHDRIKTSNWREGGNEINKEVLERIRVFKGKGGDSQDCRMGEDLVCLANCTARNVFPDIGGKARPPVILGKEGNGAKMTTMTTFEETVGSHDQIMAGQFRNIETSLIVESAIVKGPILSS